MFKKKTRNRNVGELVCCGRHGTCSHKVILTLFVQQMHIGWVYSALRCGSCFSLACRSTRFLYFGVRTVNCLSGLVNGKGREDFDAAVGRFVDGYSLKTI